MIYATVLASSSPFCSLVSPLITIPIKGPHKQESHDSAISCDTRHGTHAERWVDHCIQRQQKGPRHARATRATSDIIIYSRSLRAATRGAANNSSTGRGQSPRGFTAAQRENTHKKDQRRYKHANINCTYAFACLQNFFDHRPPYAQNSCTRPKTRKTQPTRSISPLA